MSTLALFISPGLSHAFDTECFYRGEPCSDGPGAARGQLTGDDHENEHSRIWRQTVDVAGIPDIINRPFTLSAVTGGETIIIGDETHLSQLPTRLTQATKLVEQTVTLEEFAELADFSSHFGIDSQETRPVRLVMTCPRSLAMVSRHTWAQ